MKREERFCESCAWHNKIDDDRGECYHHPQRVPVEPNDVCSYVEKPTTRLRVILEWLFGILVIVSVLFIGFAVGRAAEIVYYDDDSCVVVEKDCRTYVDKFGTIFHSNEWLLRPHKQMECVVWECDTVTYVRKEAEDTTFRFQMKEVAMTLMPADPDSYWADTLIDPDIVANLDSMIAGSCIRIPHDAPTHYFVDTVLHNPAPVLQTTGYNSPYTTYDTTFVYEVE